MLEQLEFSYTAEQSVNWYKHISKLLGKIDR